MYSCAIRGVRMCPVSCFGRYYSLQNYVSDDENCDGPWWLKEGRGRPYQRGRRKSLRNEHFFVENINYNMLLKQLTYGYMTHRGTHSMFSILFISIFFLMFTQWEITELF